MNSEYSHEGISYFTLHCVQEHRGGGGEGEGAERKGRTRTMPETRPDAKLQLGLFSSTLTPFVA
jgi:hypothetical protein